MKLEVGMYVRTEYDGILKIRDIKEKELFNEYYEMGRRNSYKEKKTLIYYRDDDRTITTNEVIKASHNIIDLIEVGDYVNGMEVLKISNNKLFVEYSTEFDDYTGYVDEKDIKSIVTKEQFEAIKYEIS